MSDIMGRNFRERRREKKFEKSQAGIEEQRKELKKALHAGNTAQLEKFTSAKALIKGMIPYILLGGVLGLVEYELVGPYYTIGSLGAYVPIIYLYSRGLRTRNGVFLMVPTSNFLDYDRLFVSNEIWDLVEKKTGLTLDMGKMNGNVTYWCIKVEYLPGSNIPQMVEIAWAHYNRVRYAMFASVFDNLTELLKDTLLEVAKLKKMGRVETITEATRQTEENIEAITSAYRDKLFNVIQKQKISEEEANTYEKEVSELLKNPDYLRALIKQKNEEDKK